MNRMKARLETPDQLGARPRFAGAHYALMQALYWGLMAAYFAFGTAYLYELGLSSLQTGLALMAAGVISAALQPLLAARADRSGRPKTVRVISMALLLPAAVLLALLWLLPLRRIFLVSLYALAWMLLWTQQFLINSLAMSYENAGWRLNYGAGRALGSLAYAAAAYAYGFLCAAQGTAVLLPVSALICTLLFVCVALWRTPEAALHASSAARQPENGGGRFAARYPRFMLLTAGAALCLTPYCTTCNYLIRVVESVGGSSVELGTAVMIAAKRLVETANREPLGMSLTLLTISSPSPGPTPPWPCRPTRRSPRRCGATPTSSIWPRSNVCCARARRAGAGANWRPG